MARALINVVNTAAQTLAANDQIDFGSVNRRFGCNLMLTGRDVQAQGSGYYTFLASVTVVPTAAGDITVTLRQNGVPIPGATATASVTTVGNAQTITVPATVRLIGCPGAEPTAAISATLSAAGTVTSASLTGEKK